MADDFMSLLDYDSEYNHRNVEFFIGNKTIKCNQNERLSSNSDNEAQTSGSHPRDDGTNSIEVQTGTSQKTEDGSSTKESETPSQAENASISRSSNDPAPVQHMTSVQSSDSPVSKDASQSSSQDVEMSSHVHADDDGDDDMLDVDGSRTKENPTAGSTGTLTPAGDPKLTNDEIMAFFTQQEQLFHSEVLMSDPPPRRYRKRVPSKPRSLSRSPARTGIGMDHLDNLVRLMEQISTLKSENEKLKRTCSYLSGTKSLLHFQNKQMILRQYSKRKMSGGKTKEQKQRGKYDSDSSDMEGDDLRPMKLVQRSQSVGSINMNNIIDLDLSRSSKGSQKSIKEVHRIFSRSQLTSQWERVKKVFSGKPEAGSSKVEASTISAEQLVRANSKHTSQHRTLTTSLSYDRVALAAREHEEHSDTKLSHSSNDIPPPSPSSISEQTIPSVVTEDDNYDSVATLAGDSGLDLEGHCSSIGSSIASDDGHGEHKSATVKDSGTDDDQKLKSNYLTVQVNMLKRRQSSPTLFSAELQPVNLPAPVIVPSSPRLGRSSSFKTTKSEGSGGPVRKLSKTAPTTPTEMTVSQSQARTTSPPARMSETKRYYQSRSAWGRVKDIIHTRKDSLKRKNLRCNSTGECLPDGNQSDGEVFSHYDEDFENWEMDSYLQMESPVNKRKDSTPLPSSSGTTSPVAKRKGSLKSMSDSPPASRRETFSHIATCGSPVDVSSLVSGFSDEFHKKLQEWEEKKRKSIYKDNGLYTEEEVNKQRTEDAAQFSEEFIRKMEEWERIKGLNSSKPHKVRNMSPECSSPDSAGPPHSSEERQKHLSASFSRTVQEWERVKTMRIKDTGSPTPEGASCSPPRTGLARAATEKRSRKPERSKSRERVTRDRSRSKYERQREKEKQKIEKKEQKIEKEKEKLLKMKHKLEALETLSNADVQGLSEEFAKRLHEWEVMKGLSTKSPESIAKWQTFEHQTLEGSILASHSRSQSVKAVSSFTRIAKGERERTLSEGEPSSPENLKAAQEKKDSLPIHREMSRSSSVPSLRSMPSTQLIDECTSVDLKYVGTSSSTSDYEKVLSSELEQREADLRMLQVEVQELTERIDRISHEHSEQIDHYKRELWASSRVGHYTIESDLIGANLMELQGHLDRLQEIHHQLAGEKEQLQSELEKERVNRMEAEKKIVEQLSRQNSSEEMATPGENEFVKICEFFKKLYAQLNELKLGVHERNSILAELQHKLLSQEVINHLLEMDLQWRQMEVSYLRDAKRAGIVRRNHTYAGADYLQRGERFPVKRMKNVIRRPISSTDDPARKLKHCQHSLDDINIDWLEKLQKNKQASKRVSAPPSVSTETHETQTDNVTALSRAEMAVQTVMTLCSAPHSSTNSSSALNSISLSIPFSHSSSTTLSSQGEKSHSKFTTNRTFGPVAMPTPLKPPRIRKVGFGNRDLDLWFNSPSSLESLDTCSAPSSATPQEAAIYTFPLLPSSERESSNMRLHSENLLNKTVVDIKSDNVSIDTHQSEHYSDRLPSRDRKYDHPPFSPRLRSRYAYKLRTEAKSETDAHLRKTTPPKDTSYGRTEIKPENGVQMSKVTPSWDTSYMRTTFTKIREVEKSESEQKYLLSEPIRERAKSDSSSLPSKTESSDYGKSITLPKDGSHVHPRIQSRQQRAAPGIKNVISLFESANRGGVERCSSPSGNIHKPTVAAMRKLKTAQELLEDTSYTGKTGVLPHKMNTVREGAVGGEPFDTVISSDKENTSKVKQIVQHFSRENTPDRAYTEVSPSSSQELVKIAVRRLSSPAVDPVSVKAPLSDVTNDGMVQDIKELLHERSSPQRQLPVNNGKKHSELPKHGTVNQRAGQFETKSTSESSVKAPPRRRSSRSSQSSPVQPIKHINSSQGSPVRPARKKDSLSQSQPHVNVIAVTPPMKDKKVHRLFSRKSSTSQASSSSTESAIAALCRQTLKMGGVDGSASSQDEEERVVSSRVEVRTESSIQQERSSSVSAHDRRRGVGKLLDAQWLQKPKRFFKVSNGYSSCELETIYLDLVPISLDLDYV